MDLNDNLIYGSDINHFFVLFSCHGLCVMASINLPFPMLKSTEDDKRYPLDRVKSQLLFLMSALEEIDTVP